MMTDIAALVSGFGGMAHKQQLVRGGARDWELTRAVRSGEVIRARQGWYTTLPDDDPAVRAVRVGGRLTGVSAVIAAGGWVLGSHPLHVAVPRNASRLRNPGDRTRRLYLGAHGVVVHWVSDDCADRGSATTVALIEALALVIVDEDLEVAVAALDWALRSGEIDSTDFETLMRSLPRYKHPIQLWVDPVCDSLPESLTRTRLRLRGHHVTSQVPLSTRERIDLVVDDLVAIETDGEEFHLTRFEQDRRKDITITIEGFHVIRPSARMIFRDWPLVCHAVELALAARKSKSQGQRARTRPRDRPLLFPPRNRGRRAKAVQDLAPRGVLD
jgi:very-short-patch-repair endonuclease